MQVHKIIEPAADWVGGNWIDRIDQSASFLYMHGYINTQQRARITQKLQRTIEDGLAKGLIVQVSPSTPTPAQPEPVEGRALPPPPTSEPPPCLEP